MSVASSSSISKRYERVSRAKASGATYTPPALADFVVDEMLRNWTVPKRGILRIIDPAAGEGALLTSLLQRLPQDIAVEVHGFESDPVALATAKASLSAEYPHALLYLREGDFLASVLNRGSAAPLGGLFPPDPVDTYDLVIANPPYVRTQVMGSTIAQALASQFGLSGRVDLYYAFILGIAQILRSDGVAGIITSNRFMTTKSGAAVRRAIRERFHLRHVWDLGDTKLFDAAVLPAVLIANGKDGPRSDTIPFSSIYETKESTEASVPSVTDALHKSGVVEVSDGRRFHVQHGILDFSSTTSEDGLWRVATTTSDAWLATVAKHTWAPFSRIGKVRVGVKTCADRVFIGRDWSALADTERPELLRPLITHHVARRFRAESCEPGYQILYPHESVGGRKRSVDLALYPKTALFLEKHRATLEARSYVIEAGRAWYEIWVPQDPSAWQKPKLVFRDISEEPCFWIDQEGSVVNGDCYWLTCDATASVDLLWLAASVGNSTFIEAFYDHSFNNKLYAGRRRFITQYVEKFPLPDPKTTVAQEIVSVAKRMYLAAGSPESVTLQKELNSLVWSAFGLSAEER